MSTEPREPAPDEAPHDDDLRERYRRLPADEPRAAIDDAILAEARRAVSAAPRGVASGTRRWRQWSVPLAMAATLAVTLVLVREERPEREGVPVALREQAAVIETRDVETPAPAAARDEAVAAPERRDLSAEAAGTPQAVASAPLPAMRAEKSAASDAVDTLAEADRGQPLADTGMASAAKEEIAVAEAVTMPSAPSAPSAPVAMQRAPVSDAPAVAAEIPTATAAREALRLDEAQRSARKSAMPACPAPRSPPPASALTPATAVVADGDDVDRARAPLGIGHLVVPEEESADWPLRLRLPLWRSADAEDFLGWLYAGRVQAVDGGAGIVLAGAGFVETAYELPSLIVWEIRGEDWLRIRLARGHDAWVPLCQLRSANVSLRFERWEDYLRRHGDWMHFRAVGRHTLHARPDETSDVVLRVARDHKLILRSIVGDWMQVIVEQPDNTCAAGDLPVSRYQGWIRWRDAASGPLVWVYTRGC